MPQFTDWDLIDFGDMEASRDPHLSDYFVSIPAYSEALRPRCNFIMGHKGSGKTAIAHQLTRELRGEYRYVLSLPDDDVYRLLAADLKEEIRAHETDAMAMHSIFFFRQAWRFVLLVEVMLEVHDDNALATGDRAIIGNFLSTNNLLRDRSFIRRISTASRRLFEVLPAFVAGGTAESGSNISRILDDLQKPSFEEAVKALLRHLRQAESRVLLCIDVMSDNFVEEGVFVGLMAGLLYAVYELTNPDYSAVLSIKCFVPIELRGKLPFRDWDKIESRTARIEWLNNAFFFELIARRLGRCLGGRAGVATNLRKVFETVFPVELPNRQGKRENTINYIVRHTQSSARQVLTMCQLIVEQARSERVPGITEAQIRKAVHDSSAQFVDSIMSAYHDIFPLTKYWINRLKGAPSFMLCGELQKRIRSASSHYKPHQLTSLDVIQQLITMGLIGIARQRDTAGFLHSEFQYSRSDELTVASSDEVVVHPLCYKHLTIRPVADVFVQPDVELWNG